MKRIMLVAVILWGMTSSCGVSHHTVKSRNHPEFTKRKEISTGSYTKVRDYDVVYFDVNHLIPEELAELRDDWKKEKKFFFDHKQDIGSKTRLFFKIRTNYRGKIEIPVNSRTSYKCKVIE